MRTRGLPIGAAGRRLLSDLIAGQRHVGTLQKPISIQFPVNDVCNSACQMCNIWQQNERSPITPDELDRLLRSDLFPMSAPSVSTVGNRPCARTSVSWQACW